ncbi:MAG: AAA family ATPase [Pirellulales bacterium]
MNDLPRVNYSDTRGESHRIDGRTDIYALGVILYELLTGKRPFRSDDMQTLFHKILHDSPQPVRQLNPETPAAVDEICMRALEKNLTSRFTTAGDFAAALLQTLGSDPAAPLSAFAADHRQVVASDKSTASTSRNNLREASQTRRLRDAELRLVSLLGVGFDVAQRLADVEEQHACAERFASIVKAIAEKHGGAMCTGTGGELEICFGFPISYEDSVTRAVRCGLEILRSTSGDECLPLAEEMLVAIHSGQAVAEESPHGVKVTGDVSVALRRLLGVLESGAVHATESAHSLCRLFFETEIVGEFKARGLSKPIVMHRVVREAPVTKNRVELVDPGNLTPLIGRDTELSILKDRWEQAAEGMGQIVLLIGEAGLGKSRLIREIREHAVDQSETPDIIELRCSQYHRAAGLYPLIEHLTQLLELDAQSNDEGRVLAIERYLESLRLHSDHNVALLASLLGIDPKYAPSLGIPPQRIKEHVAQLALDILRQRAERGPILFIVEDLHWVDPTLLDLLAAYVESFDQHRALSIFTFRPEFETPWRSKPHQTQIALNRLTRRQIRDMMRRRLGGIEVRDAVVDQIVERTDGIPLFIEEFTTLLAETGALSNSASSDAQLSLVIPTSLQGLLMARLDRLESDWGVIQLASAIGREFTFALLAAASDMDSTMLQEELVKLVDAEILFQKGKFPDASFIFKHALIQDSAYNSLLKKRRQQMHEGIATTLETHFPEVAHRQPELLAHHFTEAALVKRAVEYWLKAGKKAQAVSANVEAISHLRRGLNLLSSLEPSRERDQLELAFQTTLGPILMAARGWSAPEVGEAIERARQLCAGIGSVSDQFFVLWGLWGWRLIRGDIDICERIAEESVQLAESVPEARDLQPEAYWTVGCTAYYKGELTKGRVLLQKGLDLNNPERERVYALGTGQYCSVLCRTHIALALWQLGFPDQAIQLADESVRLAKPLNHPFSLAMATFFRRQILQFLGRDQQAAASVEDEYRNCHDQGFAFYEVHAMFGKGEFLLRKGKLAEARQWIDQGWQMRSAMGSLLSMDFPYRNLAEAFLKAGLQADAELWLDRGFDLCENHHLRVYESEFLRLRGELALARADQAGADAFYEQAIEAARREQALSWELRSTIQWAELRRSQQREAEALTRLKTCYDQFTEGFDSADLRRAAALLETLAGHP